VVNARLLLQALPLGEAIALTPAEAEATRITTEGQVERPWNLWKQLADQRNAFRQAPDEAAPD
jgi:HCOMODA/2-hydroxy-3-carboxy-muconic semialdehyde decarboxylase